MLESSWKTSVNQLMSAQFRQCCLWSLHSRHRMNRILFYPHSHQLPWMRAVMKKEAGRGTHSGMFHLRQFAPNVVTTPAHVALPTMLRWASTSPGNKNTTFAMASHFHHLVEPPLVATTVTGVLFQEDPTPEHHIDPLLPNVQDVVITAASGVALPT